MRLGLGEEACEYLDYFIARVPGRSGRALRRQYYARRLAALGQRAMFSVGIEIVEPKNISIGDHFLALRNCCLNATDGGCIRIGSHVSFAANVMINAGTSGLIELGDHVGIANNCVLRSTVHVYDDPDRPFKSQGHRPGTIVIEDDVWVSANCTVLAGTHIERGCIVAAGSVVGGRVKAFSVVAGNPARVIGRRGQ